jgi:S-adenosylmethionine:tRNA ribosyltransferase-isomerase
MMIIDPPNGSIEHGTIADLPDYLQRGDVLVLNDTRVIPARLIAAPRPGMQRPIELLLTKRLRPHTWECLAKPAKRLRIGDVLEISADLSARIVEKQEGGTVVANFVTATEGEDSFWSAIEGAGRMPLPPYIQRDAGSDPAHDRDAYQTVYADRPGAIAAPTAGLHFTRELLEEIESRGVEIVRVTLHVGIGTFRPVQADDVTDHVMDEEWYEVSTRAASLVNSAIEEGRRVVAVGTTAVRTLESAAAGDRRLNPGEGRTRLFITPGYRFRIVGALLTNFHLPESTLIMLVSAFAGRDLVMSSYSEAIDHGYYFYSYGDCMLITRLT